MLGSKGLKYNCSMYVENKGNQKKSNQYTMQKSKLFSVPFKMFSVCLWNHLIFLFKTFYLPFLLTFRNTVGQWINEFLILITIDVIFYILAHVSQQFVSPISRKMANVSFALWQISLTENRSPLYKLEMVQEIKSWLLRNTAQEIYVSERARLNKTCMSPVFCFVWTLNFHYIVFWNMLFLVLSEKYVIGWPNLKICHGETCFSTAWTRMVQLVGVGNFTLMQTDIRLGNVQINSKCVCKIESIIDMLHQLYKL